MKGCDNMTNAQRVWSGSAPAEAWKQIWIRQLNSAVDDVTHWTFQLHRYDRTLLGPAKTDHTGVIVSAKGLIKFIVKIATIFVVI